MTRYVYDISWKRSYQRPEDTKSCSVVGRHADEALDRFWVNRWKIGRDRRNELDVISIRRGGEVVV